LKKEKNNKLVHVSHVGDHNHNQAQRSKQAQTGLVSMPLKPKN